MVVIISVLGADEDLTGGSEGLCIGRFPASWVESTPAAAERALQTGTRGHRTELTVERTALRVDMAQVHSLFAAFV